MSRGVFVGLFIYWLFRKVRKGFLIKEKCYFVEYFSVFLVIVKRFR